MAADIAMPATSPCLSPRTRRQILRLLIACSAVGLLCFYTIRDLDTQTIVSAKLAHTSTSMPLRPTTSPPFLGISLSLLELWCLRGGVKCTDLTFSTRAPPPTPSPSPTPSPAPSHPHPQPRLTPLKPIYRHTCGPTSHALAQMPASVSPKRERRLGQPDRDRDRLRH
jgi:hypothetical protein